jgi:hypothetical protein
MSGTRQIDTPCVIEERPEAATGELLPLLGRATTGVATDSAGGVVIGELIAIADEGRSPLVIYRSQPEPEAVRARSVVDLHGDHIGAQVVLMFEDGDRGKPIVMGVLRPVAACPVEAPGHVEVDADGERLIVTAREQLVLRCGKSSLTLTRAGKVLIRGTYVSSTSSGVLRIKGGSVQIN